MHPTRALLLFLLCALPASAGDWPQWLGPRRDASSTEVVPVWKGALKELWRHPAGEGNGSPVVAGGRVFIHAKVKDANVEEVVAYDAVGGKEAWRTPYDRPEFKSLYGNGPRATPSVADGKVYAHGITGLLTCLDAASGKIVWQVDTQKTLGAPKLFFGTACSPLLDRGRVLLDVGAKGASFVAFDAAKGDVVWKSLSDPASYASPILTGDGAARQLIVLTGTGLASLDPAGGERYWEFPLKDALFESSTTPVRLGDRLLASSITYGSVALNLETKDGKPAYSVAWKNQQLTPYFSTPVGVENDHVFLVSGSNPLAIRKAEATLHCVDMKTGKSLWNKPGVGEYHASLLRTGDNKLLLLEEKGDLVLLDPDAKDYRELARTKVCGHTWAHAALANGKLYVRDDKDLICIELPK
jgi:outer membrane protein assembly factor BamB